MKKLLAFGWGIALLTVPLTSAHAQQTPPPPSVSLEVRDAPIRSALLQLFDIAKVQYSIDPAVTGFVNLRLTDQPFENALKLILRSSSQPLTYTIENGVYFVKPRVLAPLPVSAAPSPTEIGEVPASRLPNFEVIQLTYADPYDLAQLLNILIIPTGTRGTGGAPGAGGAAPRGAGGMPGGGGVPGGGSGILGGGGTYLGGNNGGGGSFVAGPFPGGGGLPGNGGGPGRRN